MAFCGMLTALAMIFSYVEALIPVPLGIPGIKLGLANLVVLSGLYVLRPAEVFAVSLCRILLIGFLFGTGMSILYSLAGGVLSFLVMLLLLKAGLFSRVGISAAGGVCHNVGQLLAAALVLRSFAVFSYLPVLMVSGVLTGIAIGLLSDRLAYIFPHLKKNHS